MPHDPHHPMADEGQAEAREAAAALEQAFIEGFRAAADKTAFLRLAGVPFERAIDGTPGFKLMAVRLAEDFTAGATHDRTMIFG